MIAVDALTSVEHFQNLLNQPSHYDQDIVNNISQLPTIDDLDSPIMMDELNTALNNTKLGKSPGPDGILPEILVFGGDCLNHPSCYYSTYFGTPRSNQRPH